jgi:hypothetical protein
VNPPQGDIFELASSLGIPVPEGYRAGVADALARLMEQAALVMSAPLSETCDDATDFVP